MKALMNDYLPTSEVIIIILGLNARRSPMSHLFLTRRVSQLLELALVSWAFARIGVHRPSLRLPYLMFSICTFCHWISIVFLLYSRRIATHSVDPSLTHFLGEFQAWDWLWYPMLWSQRRNSGAHGAENTIQISALAGVEPRTLASGGRGCCH